MITHAPLLDLRLDVACTHAHSSPPMVSPIMSRAFRAISSIFDVNVKDLCCFRDHTDQQKAIPGHDWNVHSLQVCRRRRCGVPAGPNPSSAAKPTTNSRKVKACCKHTGTAAPELGISYSRETHVATLSGASTVSVLKPGSEHASSRFDKGRVMTLLIFHALLYGPRACGKARQGMTRTFATCRCVARGGPASSDGALRHQIRSCRCAALRLLVYKPEMDQLELQPRTMPVIVSLSLLCSAEGLVD